MNWPLFVSRRYLLSRRSHNAIHIISAISAIGVTVASMALVCTLSVFNGFQGLVADLFTAFDPQLRITLAEGKTFSESDGRVAQIAQLDEVAVLTPVLEDQALVVQEGHQTVVTIKGVADNYLAQAQLSNLLYGQGTFMLESDGLDYGVLGIQLAARLGLNALFTDPLEVYAPRRGERVNMANPLSSFNRAELNSPGVVFMVQQGKYDENYILTSLSFAQNLFDGEGKISALEVRLCEGTDEDAAREKIQQILGTEFMLQNRYEQQEDVFRIMRVEKLISYLFLTFILLVACFNLIGSLSMLMIEKRADMHTLRSLGADHKAICRVFIYQGCMISTIGAAVGILLGVGLCLLQQYFGLLSMGGGSGDFIVDAYPVQIELSDLLVVLLTVVAVSWAAVWFPVRKLSRSFLLVQSQTQD